MLFRCGSVTFLFGALPTDGVDGFTDGLTVSLTVLTASLTVLTVLLTVLAVVPSSFWFALFPFRLIFVCVCVAACCRSMCCPPFVVLSC